MPAPLPADPLYRVLLNVLNPCPHLEGACKGVMRRSPITATPPGDSWGDGRIDEVELVIVTAEPGEPLSGERQEIENLTPEERVRVESASSPTTSWPARRPERATTTTTC